MKLRTSLTVLGLASASMLAARLPAHAGEGSPGDVPGFDRSMSSVIGEIDDHIAMAWEKEGLEANGLCSDSEYVRRTFLDIVGAVPTPKQVREFVADERTGKRARLVDALLESPGYARHAANQWGAVLVGSVDDTNGREYNGSLFRRWLEERFAANVSFGEIGSAMLTESGTVYTNPALNFMGKRNHDPKDIAGSVSRVFMGVQIQCAQCHDHPYEDITQRDFQGMASFFARVTVRREEIPYEMFGPDAIKRAERRYENDVKKLVENGYDEERARRTAEQRKPKSMKIGDLGGHVRLPRRYKQRMDKRVGDLAKTAPKFLAGDTYEDVEGGTRRQALAEWIFDAENPNTPRALANRYWKWLLGRGFVHPVDDFNSVNIPSVPAALDALARDVAAHSFDVKRLIRVITRTQAYQLTTSGGERTPHAIEFFAAGPLKPLSPQVTFDSLQVALGVADNGAGMSGLDGSGGMSSMDMGRGGMMGMKGEKDRNKRLLRGAARNFFQTFDDDEGGEAEAFEGTIPQGLFLMNSQVVNGLLTNPNVSVIPKVMEHFQKPKDRIRHLFLRTLSREPTKKELKAFADYIAQRKGKPSIPGEADDAGPRAKRKARRKKFARRNKEAAEAQPLADILWTLVSTTEFATNH